MRLKHVLSLFLATVLTMGLIPAGIVIAGVSGVTIDTVGTPTTSKSGIADVQMMNINITSDLTSDTLVKLTVTYTGTSAADVSAVKLYDGGTLMQGQTLISGQAVFNVSKALAGSSTTTLTVKADINAVADGRLVQFRLDPGSVVLQTSGAAVAAYTLADHGVTIDGTPPNPPVISLFPTVNITSKAAAPISGTAEANAAVSGSIKDMMFPMSSPVPFVATADGSGAWSASPNVTGLFDGPLTASATATDAAGNVSPASTATTLKDTVAPGTVVFDSGAAYVSNANQGNVSVSGTAEGNATVDLTVSSDAGGTPLPFQTIAVSPGNTFSFANVNLSSLPDGMLTFWATVTDGAGNKSATVGSLVGKDTVANPPFVALDDGHANANNYLLWHVSGTAEPGATVNISVDDSGPAAPVIANTTANGLGAYSFTMNLSGLADGNLTASATQTDPAGNLSAPQTRFALKDIIVPAAPLISAFNNANNANQAAVPMNGTAEADVRVDISVVGGATATATAVADGSGNWTTTVDVSALTDGPMSATATATDAANNISGPSAAFTTATKDAGVPGAPINLTFATVNNASKAAAPISGKAEANADISITVSDAGAVNTASATTTANASGDWSTTVNVTGLNDGTITASVTATDAALNTSSVATKTTVKDTVALVPGPVTHPSWVNEANKAAVPFSGGVGSVEPGATVSIQVIDVGAAHNQTFTTPASGDGSWATTVNLSTWNDTTLTVDVWQVDVHSNISLKMHPGMGKDVAAPQAPSIDALPTWVNSTTQTVLTVSGTAEFGATVNVTVTDAATPANSASPLAVIADEFTGIWTTTVNVSALAEGSISATATATDVALNPSGTSAPSTSTKDVTPPGAPVISPLPTVFSGNAGSVGISGTAEVGTTVAVMVTSAGGGMPVSANMIAAGGNYSFTLDLSGLIDGQLTATATATDPAGNVSTVTAKTATKDTVANPPTGTQAPAWVNLMNQSAVTFSGAAGSAEAGATVYIRVWDAKTNDVTFTATADSNGAWSKAVNLTAWDEGSLSVDFSQVDLAGNTSITTSTSITKDTARPTILSASVAYGLDDAYESYAWNRQATISATASESVTWTWTAKNPFGNTLASGSTVEQASLLMIWAPGKFAASGNYTVTLSATDPAGNTVVTLTTLTIPVYNYDFRITGTRILNSDKTTEALSVTAGNDYYAEVTIENLNACACAPEVVFQQTQGVVQAFTSAAVSVPGESTATFTFLWHPTTGIKHLDFFVWNHLAPAGREALSEDSQDTITVN